MSQSSDIREISELVRRLKPLGNKYPRQILMILSKAECSVTELQAQIIVLPQSTVSFHLNSLKEIGMVKKERRGKEVFYSVDDRFWSLKNALDFIGIPESQNQQN